MIETNASEVSKKVINRDAEASEMNVKILLAY
jgi:hypothetical protein